MFVTVNEARYRVEMTGEGQALLMLHGFTGSAESWRECIWHFEGRRRAIMVDLLGHGWTDAPNDPARYRIERAAADLIALLDALNLPRVDLLGYSMGGRLGLFTAIAAPSRVRRLVLESATAGLATEAERAARRAADEALADRIERNGIPAFVDEWEKLPLFASQTGMDEEKRSRLREQRLQNRARGLANSLRGMGTGTQPSLWGALHKVEAPALLITGALDGKFEAIARQMRERLPRAAHVIIAGAGHTPHLEQPEAFARDVETFLDDGFSRETA